MHRKNNSNSNRKNPLLPEIGGLLTRSSSSEFVEHRSGRNTAVHQQTSEMHQTTLSFHDVQLLRNGPESLRNSGSTGPDGIEPVREVH